MSRVYFITFSRILFYKVKDESIVRLTNQIHEMELKTVVTLSTSVPPSPRLNTPGNFTKDFLKYRFKFFKKYIFIFKKKFSVFNFKQKQSLQRVNSNGISFDSDKGEFKEFVDVGVQTNDKASTVSILSILLCISLVMIRVG